MATISVVHAGHYRILMWLAAAAVLVGGLIAGLVLAFSSSGTSPTGTHAPAVGTSTVQIVGTPCPGNVHDHGC